MHDRLPCCVWMYCCISHMLQWERDTIFQCDPKPDVDGLNNVNA